LLGRTKEKKGIKITNTKWMTGCLGELLIDMRSGRRGKLIREHGAFTIQETKERLGDLEKM